MSFQIGDNSDDRQSEAWTELHRTGDGDQGTWEDTVIRPAASTDQTRLYVAPLQALTPYSAAMC